MGRPIARMTPARAWQRLSVSAGPKPTNRSGFGVQERDGRCRGVIRILISSRAAEFRTPSASEGHPAGRLRSRFRCRRARINPNTCQSDTIAPQPERRGSTSHPPRASRFIAFVRTWPIHHSQPLLPHEEQGGQRDRDDARIGDRDVIHHRYQHAEGSVVMGLL
jgi:hypothetical protein